MQPPSSAGRRRTAVPSIGGIRGREQAKEQAVAMCRLGKQGKRRNRAQPRNAIVRTQHRRIALQPFAAFWKP